jgi:hypothetical protein
LLRQAVIQIFEAPYTKQNFKSRSMAKVSDLGPPSIHDLLADSAYRESFWTLFEAAFRANYHAIAVGQLRFQ